MGRSFFVSEIFYCIFGYDGIEWNKSGEKWYKSGEKWWRINIGCPPIINCFTAQLKVMSMFMGEYNHTVDTKGRLIVPSKFREALGGEFVVTKGLDGCLFVYPGEEWKLIEEKFREVSQFSKEARKFARNFFAGAAACEVDKQGRVLLPATLRDFAGIEKEVVLAGVLNHVEIWSKDRWQEANEYDDVEEIAEHMAGLGLII